MVLRIANTWINLFVKCFGFLSSDPDKDFNLYVSLYRNSGKFEEAKMLHPRHCMRLFHIIWVPTRDTRIEGIGT